MCSMLMLPDEISAMILVGAIAAAKQRQKLDSLFMVVMVAAILVLED
jgi:hypothetical protein